MSSTTAVHEDVRTPRSLQERLADFQPESYHDFSDPETAERMRAALREVESELGRSYPDRIGGRDVTLEETLSSMDPADPDRVVGIFPKADAAHADRAVAAASEAFESWKRVPAEERVEILFRAADIMRRRRLELAAWMVFEVGKS
jgi:1-pyrroline-5-carboxylate dehydrogenase